MSSGDDALQSAVTALLTKLEVQEQSVRDTKKTINTLLHHIGKPVMFAEAEEEVQSRAGAAMRPDQFYGRPLATVAKEVLEARGQAMPAQDILDALERGGYDLAAQGWKEKDRLRSFTITLSKNIIAFHRLPNGSFGLPKWYPEAMKQKQAAKAEKNATAAEETPEGEENLDPPKI
jgi:hypothetical protein